MEAAMTTAEQGVRNRIRGLLPELRGASRQIGESILAEPAASAAGMIGDVAARAGTSAASVTRFSRELGYAGYSEFRLGLTADLARHEAAGWEVDVGTGIAPGDSIAQVAAVIRSVETATINDTLTQLDLAAVTAVARALSTARRIDLFGIGGSGLLAAEMQQRLHRIGRPAWSWTDPHAALASVALSEKGDVLLALSHSGRTRETLDVVAEAARRNATTVVLTNFPRSPVARAADHILTTAVHDTTFGPEAIAARHAALAVIDCVYIAVAQRTHKRTTAAFRRTTEAVLGHRIAEGARTKSAPSR